MAHFRRWCILVGIMCCLSFAACAEETVLAPDYPVPDYVTWLLDIARCLYTLETGGILSKTRAGQWALEQQLCPVPEALTLALQVRQDPPAALADPACMARAAALGPDIQRFADVLETRLSHHT